MLKVAITGNIASGKSQVENTLREKGYFVVDTDEISHQLLEEDFTKKEIVLNFGDEILVDGKISREKLADIVFNDEKSKLILERIIHTKVKEILSEIFDKNADEKAIFVSVPQLFEANMQDMFDKIILIMADDDIRLKRLMERNNMSKKMAQRRLESQMEQRTKQGFCDFVIENNTSVNDLKYKITAVIDNLFPY